MPRVDPDLVYAGFTLDLMLGNSPFQQNDDRAVFVLRQDIDSCCPRRYVEGLMMSCRLARPKSGLIERQLLGNFGVATGERASSDASFENPVWDDPKR